MGIVIPFPFENRKIVFGTADSFVQVASRSIQAQLHCLRLQLESDLAPGEGKRRDCAGGIIGNSKDNWSKPIRRLPELGTGLFIFID